MLGRTYSWSNPKRELPRPIGCALIVTIALSNMVFSRQQKEQRARLVIKLTGVFGLILLLGTTILAWQIVKVINFERNLAAFESLAADNEHAMKSRLNSYRQSLDGGAALFQASGTVSLDKWKSYVDVLNIEETLPGINGIGFIQPVQKARIEDYLQSAKDRGVENIEIHPSTDLPEILSITYIEPVEPNKNAVGLDIAFEANRREAAYHARDTGKATITKRIHLVQDQTKSAGFLLLRPMYKQGHMLKTQEQRRAAFRGWIYAPFIASRFMTELTSSQGKTLDIEVYDGTAPFQSDLIFASDSSEALSQKSLYSINRSFRMMEQNWTVVWKSTPEFEASVNTREPILILTAGIAVSCGFIILMFFYGRREAYVRNEVKIKTEELVQKEREISHALARAEAATVAKSKFLANMSHEIRTPMNGVIGFTQLLDDGNLDDKQKRYVQMISESGSVMMNLLNDILDISKVDAGLMEINIAPMDTRHILNNCMKMVSPTAETKGLALDMEVDPLLPKLVKGDGLRLRQVILNLLANAIKFTDKGHVQLAINFLLPETKGSAENQFAEMIISVSDTGIGIAPERQAAVFQPFQQADDSTARKYGGTGLGLSISNQLVDLMGGQISMESELLKGSKFTIKLPVELCGSDDNRDADVQAKVSTNPVKKLRAHNKKKTILVAEDHDVNKMLVSEMLSNLGFDVKIAGNGLEAVEMVNQAKQQNRLFDLVLMDIQMPLMDGLKAAKTIRNGGVSPTQMPIIALTANAYTQDITDCLSAGMQAHLSKPFSVEDLNYLLKTWIVDEAKMKAA